MTTRRKFDEAFREGAVRIVVETGKPIAQVARELGIHDGTLGNWVAADRRRRAGDGRLSEDERQELLRLRREVAELTMERDVLKRSVALWVLSRHRDKTHYAEDRIMSRAVRMACGVRDSLPSARHNQSASRKASSASAGRYRPGVASRGVVRARPRSFMLRSACR